MTSCTCNLLYFGTKVNRGNFLHWSCCLKIVCILNVDKYCQNPPKRLHRFMFICTLTLASPEYNKMLLIISIIVKTISLFSFPFFSLWELGHHFACLLAIIISSLRSVSSFALPIFLFCMFIGCSPHWGYSSLWVMDIGPLPITYFDLIFYFFHM